MKKNTAKLLALLLAMAMVLGVLAGCGSSSSSTATDNTTSTTEESTAEEPEAEEPAEEPEAEEPEAEAPAEEAPAEEAPAEEGEAPAEEAEEPEAEGIVNEPVNLPIVDEAVHYTCWMPMAPYVSSMIDLSNFSNDIAIVKTISELTNVYIDFTAVAGAEVEEEAFNLMRAAGDYLDILGVMNYYPTGHEGAIDDDVIIDLYDQLQELAPNYWNLLTSDDNAYMTMLTESGYMGCIAQLYKKAGMENMGMIIRKDWLEESGLGTLTTMDDLEAYLTYCADTYGAYAYLQPEGNDTDLGSAFNISPGNFNVIDGEIIHSYTTDAYKAYLTKLNDWYTKGLFNDDFYNDTDVTTVRQDMANDMCSLVDGSNESMSNIYDMNPDNPNMVLTAIPYMLADGVDEVHVGYQASLIKNSDTWSVSTACGDITALLGLVNYLYSEDGQLVYNWGNEGESFEFDENGDPQWTDLVINNEEGLNFMFASYLYATGIGSVYYPGVYDMEKGFYSYDEEQLNAVDVFSSLTDGAYNLPAYVSLTTEEQLAYNEIATDLDTYASTQILNFIMGDTPISEFDTFVNTLYDMGLQDMIDIYQGAYDRAHAKLEAIE